MELDYLNLSLYSDGDGGPVQRFKTQQPIPFPRLKFGDCLSLPQSQNPMRSNLT